MACFPIKRFKTVKHSLNWMEHVNDFLTVLKYGEERSTTNAQPVQNCCLVRVTCMLLITDTSGCQLTCMWLYNTNGQLSGTEKHV